MRERQARRAIAIVGVLLAAGLAGSPAEGATGNPIKDYTESDVLLADTTWTGEKVLTRGVVVAPGATLTIHNATVKFNTTTLRHFGLIVEPTAKLVVRDSLLTNNLTTGSDFDRTRAYWDFFSKGVVDVQRSTIRHAGDISIEVDTSRGSVLRDVDLVWLARGVHVLRTNLTDAPGWDLVMEDVLIRDMPIVVGAGTPDIGGAIGILNGDVLIRNVTIERARTTGVFVDRSSVSDKTDSFGNTVEAHGLVVIGGSPPGMTGQGALLQVRTTGSFLCEQCAFVSPTPGGWMSLLDGHTIRMRDTTIVDTTLAVKLPATADARIEGLELRGPTAGIRYLYANAADVHFERVDFDAGTTGGVHAEKLLLRSLPDVWWGDASGPLDTAAEDGSVPASNAGSGRPVGGSIDYSGWATTPHDRDGIRLALDPLPEAVAPGSSYHLGYTVTNGGSAPAAVDLRAVGILPATLSLPSTTLAAGESASGVLTLALPSSLAPASKLGVTLIATSPSERAAAHSASVVGATVPRLRVSTPAPYADLSGTFAVTGSVIEPTTPSSGAPLPAGGPPDANGDAVDDRAQLAPGSVSVLVRHEEGADRDVRGAIVEAGGHVVRDLTLAPILWAIAPSDALPDLAARDDVRDVWWDEPAQAQLVYATRAARARSTEGAVMPGGTAPDTSYAGVWRGNPVDGYHGPTGRGVLMAVVDSGIDPAHVSTDDMDDDASTLDAKIVARISTFTVLATDAADVSLSSMVSPGSHGTMVAGAAAGTGAQFMGPVDAPVHGTTQDDPWLHAGAAPGARIVDVDAWEDTGEVGGLVNELEIGAGTLVPNAGFGLAVEGFEAVAAWNRDHPEDPIRIVQLSLGIATSAVDHPVNDIVDALAAQNVLVVVAVGNNHPAAVVPATAKKALAVGATRIFDTVSRADDGKAAFSDVSSAEQIAAGRLKPEIMAPGAVLAMPRKDSLDAYVKAEGTSFAAPLVSGVAALVLEAGPDLHAAQVKEILIRSSEPRGGATGLRYTDVNLDFEDDLADGGWEPAWGYGYLDAEEAVRLARETTPRSPPAPPTLTLYAAGDDLAAAPPAGSAILFGEAEWAHVATEPISIGDGDPSTDETAVLVLAAPSAELGASAHSATAELYRDDELVASFRLIDDRVSTSTEREALRLPMLLGKSAESVLRGADTGSVVVTGTLDVLDEHGTLRLDEGETLRLLVRVNHSGGAPAPIVTGPTGTRIRFELDPSTLANGGGPSAVSGSNADWNATSVSVQWGPAADDHGVGRYHLFRDGELLAVVSGAQHGHLDAVQPGATHTYRVRAVDIHGIPGPLGPEVLVRVPPATGRAIVVDVAGTSALATDLTGDGTHALWSAELAPTRVGRHQLRSVLFVDGEAVGTTVLPVNVRTTANVPPVVELGEITGILRGARPLSIAIADANGDEDLVAREWRVDGGAWRPVAGNALLLDAATLPPGSHTLEARAIDAAGAEGRDSLAFESEPWTATLEAPAVLPDGHPVPVRVHATGQGLSADALRLAGSGVASFEIALTGADGAYDAILPRMGSGLLRLEVRAGEDILASATRIVDRPPTAHIVAPATLGSRLDTLVLVDASTDDSGFAQRTWTLPDGTSSTAALLAFPLRNVSVGPHEIRLAVTNLNGLAAEATLAIDVIDLAPTIVASPFRLLGAPVSHAYTGETIAIDLNISDPEGDPLVIVGGLEVDGALVPVGPGGEKHLLRPLSPGTLRLDVAASDPWRTTTLTKAIPVHANTPPVALLIAPAKVDAGRTTWLDSRASYDPDRAIASRTIDVPGIGNWTNDRVAVWLPMGTWRAELAVVDTSGATSRHETTILSDDWLSATMAFTRAPSPISEGEALVTLLWHDGIPAANASVQAVVRHAHLGFERTLTATTDAEGKARFGLGLDAGPGNVPGPHEIVVTASHASRAGAPVQDVENAQISRRYDV